jgi:anti-sigma28 factor (negative regulator of flagellin synthesis)
MTSVLSQSPSDMDARTERVESVQQAVAAGTYKVSSSGLADRLIESMQR